MIGILLLYGVVVNVDDIFKLVAIDKLLITVHCNPYQYFPRKF